MSSGGRPILIAGGGIAGLTAALSLARLGIRSKLFESAPAFTTVGAGVQISPNATRVLEVLGVLADLRADAVRPEGVDIRRASNLKLVMHLPLGAKAEARWGAPYFVIHRAALIEVLARRAMAEPLIDLTMDARLEAVQKTGGLIHATVNASNHRFIQDATLVIGADGVWSGLRRQIEGGMDSQFAGLTAWRSLVDAGTIDIPTDRITAFLDTEAHLVAYPVDCGSRLNLVAVTRGGSAAPGWSGEGDIKPLQALFARSDPRLRALAEVEWTRWPLYESDPGQAWRGNGIVLIGDAAHAMLPFAAQGAAMAIEDAAILAQEIARAPDAIEVAAKRFEARRRPRLQRVLKRGRLNRLAWHASGPISLARDLVFRAKGPDGLLTDLDWLYGYDALAEG